MKRIAIIGTAGVPGKYGGFETLAHQLVKQWKGTFALTVYCSKNYYPKQDRVSTWEGARLVYLPFNANGVQSILYDLVSMLHALFVADTFIVLGVSGGVMVPFLRWFTRKKIIVNIDGLEWRRQKWSPLAKRFLRWSERLAVRFSHADVADNDQIKRYTAIQYKTLSHMIAYGGDHTQRVALSRETKAQYPFTQKPYAFKVCRIEPENNIHEVLAAFEQCEDMPLVLVGNWQASAYGQQLLEKYRRVPNLHLLPPIYDQRALDELRSNCFVYIHGHSAGGTNPSLVEAMYLGLPVLAFDVSYNRSTTDNQAFYFKNAQDLSKQLQHWHYRDFRANGNRMVALAQKRYTWAIVAGKYKRLVFAFDYSYSKKNVLASLSRLQSELLASGGLGHLKNVRTFYES